MSPLISVVVPIYNIERYLKNCIDSILNQDFSDMEVILVDDGSTDGCPGICDQYAKDDKRVKVIHKPNGGLVSARKAGALAATGKYIATVDGDDGVTENFFEEVNNVIREHKPDIIMFDPVEIRGEQITEKHSFLREGLYDKQQIEKELFPFLIEDKMSRYIAPSQNYMVILRSIYMLCEMPIDERIKIGEDGVCTKPAICRANSLYVLHKCLSIYNINQDSMTKGKKTYDMMWPYYVAKQYEKMIDMSRFDFKDQVCRFVTHNLFVASVTQFYKDTSYKDTKRELHKYLSDKYYFEAIKNCKFSFKNFKGTLAKYCLENRWYFIMKLCCAFAYKQ